MRDMENTKIFMECSLIDKTAEKVKTEITLKLYDKETHNIYTNVESISDIEVFILDKRF